MKFFIATIKGEPSVIEDRAHESLIKAINSYINENDFVCGHLHVVNIETRLDSTSKIVSTITGVRQYTYTGIAHISILQEEDVEKLFRVKEEVAYLKGVRLWTEDEKLPWYKRIFRKKKTE